MINLLLTFNFLTFVVFFLIGASIASFLNVIADRAPKKKDFIKSRSICDHCGKKLTWWELIPVLGYILLKGKCVKCKKKISPSYPIIEILLGAFYVLALVSNMGILLNSPLLFSLKLIFELIIISIFFFIAIYDYKYYIISNYSILLLFIVSIVSFVLVIIFHYLHIIDVINFADIESFTINHIISAIIFFLFFFLVFLITSGKGIGGGDVKLSFVIGLILGIKSSIASLYVTLIAGALISVLLIILKIKGPKDRIPFGPFLAFGLIIAILYGESIANIFFYDIFNYFNLVLGIKII